MPDIDIYESVYVSVDEFYEQCSNSEKKHLLQLIIEDKSKEIDKSKLENLTNIFDLEWKDAIQKIWGNNRLKMQQEDIDTIIKIADKY